MLVLLESCWSCWFWVQMLVTWGVCELFDAAGMAAHFGVEDELDSDIYGKDLH